MILKVYFFLIKLNLWILNDFLNVHIKSSKTLLIKSNFYFNLNFGIFDKCVWSR